MQKWSKYLAYKRHYAIKYRRVLIIFKLFYAYLVGTFLFLISSYVLDNYISLINFIEKVFEDVIANPIFIFIISMFSFALFVLFVLLQGFGKKIDIYFILSGIFFAICMFLTAFSFTTKMFDYQNDYYGWIDHNTVLPGSIFFIIWVIYGYISYLYDVRKKIDLSDLSDGKDVNKDENQVSKKVN